MTEPAMSPIEFVWWMRGLGDTLGDTPPDDEDWALIRAKLESVPRRDERQNTR